MQAQDINGRSAVYNDYQRVTPERMLDESVFYKLLITQLQNQDPLSPMNPEDFTAQLAQLTQLEEMRKLNSYMGLMFANLIGKEVITDEDKNAKKITGVEIDNKNHNLLLELEDGSTANLNDIRIIKESNEIQDQNKKEEVSHD